MNNEQAQWVEAACEMIVDSVDECCGTKNHQQCERCLYRMGAIALLSVTGDCEMPEIGLYKVRDPLTALRAFCERMVERDRSVPNPDLPAVDSLPSGDVSTGP